MIIVCDEGYSSSLAAASLRRLGIERATDLIGGFQAWKRFCVRPKSVRWKIDPMAPGRCGHI
jgi:3-mercaptopyruvate sulfurtransferase SseA